jgi:ribonuclease HI
MRGEYRVKHPALRPLFAEAQRLRSQLASVTFEHVRREHNCEADRLANLAMDEAAALHAEEKCKRENVKM